MKNTKIVNIRALAIILVVLGHSIILYSSQWDLYETINQVPVLDNMKRIIDVIQMPLFFSISGFLFCYSKNKKINFFAFFKNKFFRLLIPYMDFGSLDDSHKVIGGIQWISRYTNKECIF